MAPLDSPGAAGVRTESRPGRSPVGVVVCGKCTPCKHLFLRRVCDTLLKRTRTPEEQAELLRLVREHEEGGGAGGGGGGGRARAEEARRKKFVDVVKSIVDTDGFFSQPRAVPLFVAAAGEYGDDVALRTFMINSVLSKIQPNVASRLLEEGGLDIIADWMSAVRESGAPTAAAELKSLIKVGKKLPVTREQLVASRVRKVIKKLSKGDEDTDKVVSEQAKALMKHWTEAVQKSEACGGAMAGGVAPVSAKPVAAKPAPKPVAAKPVAAAPPKPKPMAMPAVKRTSSKLVTSSMDSMFAVPPSKVSPRAAAPKAPVPAAPAPKTAAAATTPLNKASPSAPQQSKPAAPASAANAASPKCQDTAPRPQPSIEQAPVSLAVRRDRLAREKAETEAAKSASAAAPTAAPAPARTVRPLSSFLSSDATKPKPAAGGKDAAARAGTAAGSSSSGKGAAGGGTKRPLESPRDTQAKDAAVAGMPKPKKKKKSVSWALGDKLVSVRYFTKEGAEGEGEQKRAASNLSMADLQKQEHERERRLRQEEVERKRAALAAMASSSRWYEPQRFSCNDEWACGGDSKEKGAQFSREQGVLAAVYPTTASIPETPSEPDESSGGQQWGQREPTEIPLNDADSTVKVVPSPAQRQQQQRPPPPPPPPRSSVMGAPPSSGAAAPPINLDTSALMKLQEAMRAVTSATSGMQAPMPQAVQQQGMPLMQQSFAQQQQQQQQQQGYTPQQQQQVYGHQQFGFGGQQVLGYQQQNYQLQYGQQQQGFQQQGFQQAMQPHAPGWKPPLPPGGPPQPF